MTLTETTLAFIRDYKKWNDYALKTSESGRDRADLLISNAYDDTVLKYCRGAPISIIHRP